MVAIGVRVAFTFNTHQVMLGSIFNILLAMRISEKWSINYNVSHNNFHFIFSLRLVITGETNIWLPICGSFTQCIRCSDSKWIISIFFVQTRLR